MIEWLKKLFGWILFWRKPKPKTARMFFGSVSYGAFVIMGEIKMAIIRANQQIALALDIKDFQGNPAQVDGVPVWESDNVAVLTVQPASDGLSAIAKAVGPVGRANVIARADADLGAGVSEIVTPPCQIDVAAAMAASISIVEGEVTDQV
jgi:hypothetical protein